MAKRCLFTKMTSLCSEGGSLNWQSTVKLMLPRLDELRRLPKILHFATLAIRHATPTWKTQRKDIDLEDPTIKHLMVWNPRESPVLILGVQEQASSASTSRRSQRSAEDRDTVVFRKCPNACFPPGATCTELLRTLSGTLPKLRTG